MHELLQLQTSKYFEQDILSLAFRLFSLEDDSALRVFLGMLRSHRFVPMLLHLHPHTQWMGHRWIGRWRLQSRSIRLSRLYRLFHLIIDFQNHLLGPVFQYCCSSLSFTIGKISIMFFAHPRSMPHHGLSLIAVQGS